MSRFLTFTFQVSIMSNWLAKHISTNVSFKITIRKGHVYIDIRWPWKCIFGNLKWWTNQINIFAFISVRYTFKFTEQKWSKFINELCTLICIWMLAVPIGIIQLWTPRKWSFLLYFSSLHDYWLPTTLISLVHNSLCKMEWCEKRAFQLLKMRKMKVS